MMGLCCNRSLSPSTTVFKIVPAALTLILFVPLAVALRYMRAETQARLATAEPAEKARLQERARYCGNGLRRSQQSLGQFSCVAA